MIKRNARSVGIGKTAIACAVAAIGLLAALPAFADTEIEQLKRELADQRKLIQQLLDAQGGSKTVESGRATKSQVEAAPADPTKAAVTFYGALDVNISSADSGFGRKTTFGAGGMTASSIGVKVEKTLVDKLKLIGEAEAGVAIDTGVVSNGSVTPGLNASSPSSGSLLGNGSQILSRQAYAGLAGDFGAVTFGRQYAASYVYAAAFGSSMGGGFLGNGAALQTSIGGMPTRLNNSLVYKTPSLNGFSGQFTYTTGSENNVAVDTKVGTTVTNDQAGQGYDLGLGYRRGSLFVGLTTWDINAASYAFAGETALAKKKASQIVANYDFGFMKLYGSYVKGTISGGNYENISKTLSNANGASISATFPFGRNKVYVSYAELKDESLLGRDATLFGLAYTYEIAPGQKLYANWGKMNNSANASYSLVSGADLVGSVATPGFSPSALMVGLNFSF